MATFHRKTLIKSIKIPCTPVHSCDHPPPPPPPPLPRHHSLSPFLILMFCGLAVSFSFICYFTLYKRYYRALRDTRQRNPRNNTDETNEVFVDEDLGPVAHHHIWLINTIGLEQSVIESIHVFRYKRDQGLIEGTDCSVCLSEFQDDESLRLLPKCSHAFHVPCIDTWLRSHKNCPLCRAPIIKNTSAQTDTTIDSNLNEQSTTREETPGEEDSETVDHVERNQNVVENNGEVVEKTSGILNEASSGVRVHSDLADHHRVQGEESVAMRRSVSMDESSASTVHFAVANIPLPDHSSSRLVLSKKPHKLRGSSSSISICSRVIKSSSRKASWSCSSTGKVLP